MGSGQPKNLHAVIQSFHDQVWLSNIGFSLKQPDIQMSTDKLGLFNGRVMPSTYHEVIRLCIHDKKLSFMTSQVCDPEFSVRDLQIRIYTYDTYECMIWIYVSIPVLDMYCLIMCLAEQHASPEFQNDSLAQTRLIRSSESAHMHIAP